MVRPLGDPSEQVVMALLHIFVKHGWRRLSRRHVPGIGSQPSVSANLPCPLPRSLPLTHEVCYRNFPLAGWVGYEWMAFLVGRGRWE